MDFFKAYTNWRVHVLTILALVAAILLFGECESFGMLLLTKGVGFAVALVIYFLFLWWNENGKLNELNNLLEEE